MSVTTAWSARDTEAFRRAWSRFQRDFKSINSIEGLHSKKGASIGTHFRVPRLRDVYEAYIADFLGTELWERFSMNY